MLTIYRGIPGSGKSTRAAENDYHDYVFSADNFFMRDSDYCFDPKRLAEAHSWCLSQTFLRLGEGSNVAVANTFIRTWEMSPYCLIARSMGITVEIVEFIPVTVDQIQRAHKRNVHGVPLNVIADMAARFEHIEPELIYTWECLRTSVRDW